jgi:hypothetical protein
MSPPRVALNQFIEINPEYPGDELQACQTPAIPRRAQIGGDDLGGPVGNPPRLVNMETERAWKTLISLMTRKSGAVGRAFNDDGENAGLSVLRLEANDFVLNPT